MPPKREVDAGRGVGPIKNGVYLDFGEAIDRLGRHAIEERYGNLFQMYDRITGEDPYKVPMRIYPAVHYTMGGLWVDYNLMSNVPGLFVLGEANFSDHGANRLGASALMQGLADGYFVLPATINDYLAPLLGTQPLDTADPAFTEAEANVAEQTARMLGVQGTRTVDHFHRELGKIMWDDCGMARSAESLDKAIAEIPALREEFWSDVRVLGENETFNQSLEKAGRVADFLEFGELLVRDARHREESCGGHFRVEYQTEEGEALRRDDEFAYAAAWEWEGVGNAADAPQGAPRVRPRPPRAAQLQVGGRRAVDLTLRVWRQSGPEAPGRFETYAMPGVSEDMSFLELFDVLNEKLVADDEEPIAFDHDCREGICGSCAMMIDGRAHGPEKGTATCQLHLRKLQDGAVITVEPWRAAGFPIIKDLAVDRSRVRPHRRGRRLHHRAHRRRPRRQRDPRAQGGGRRRDGRRRLHRLRRVRGCVPEQRGAALHRGEVLAPLAAAPGPARALHARRGHGRGDGAVLRLLHEPRRVRAGVPEGDLDRLHRAAEPRLREGAVQEHPARRPTLVRSALAVNVPPPVTIRDRVPDDLGQLVAVARRVRAADRYPEHLPEADFERFLTRARAARRGSRSRTVARSDTSHCTTSRLRRR